MSASTSPMSLDLSTRRLLLLGPATTIAGIVGSFGSAGSISGALVVLGFAATIVGLHKLGRSGVEHVAPATTPVAPKK